MRFHLLRHVGLAVLLAAFLTAIIVPRFGLVWHEHDDAEHDHAAPELARLLGSVHEAHAHQHAPDHDQVEASQTSLFDADTSRLHGHYVEDTLLVFSQRSCLYRPIKLRLFLPLLVYRTLLRYHHIVLLARAPPAPLLPYLPQAQT